LTRLGDRCALGICVVSDSNADHDVDGDGYQPGQAI
jgi:hypothetical protein